MGRREEKLQKLALSPLVDGSSLGGLLGGRQRRKKPTLPPPKENLVENFSRLKEKLSRPVVDTKTL